MRPRRQLLVLVLVLVLAAPAPEAAHLPRPRSQAKKDANDVAAGKEDLSRPPGGRPCHRPAPHRPSLRRVSLLESRHAIQHVHPLHDLAQDHGPSSGRGGRRASSRRSTYCSGRNRTRTSFLHASSTGSGLDPPLGLDANDRAIHRSGLPTVTHSSTDVWPSSAKIVPHEEQVRGKAKFDRGCLECPFGILTDHGRCQPART